VHTYEELTNSFRDVSSKCHSLISDGGKEITKLLSSSNRTLKVSKGAPAWKAYVDYIGDIVIDGLVECIIASVHRLTSQVRTLSMCNIAWMFVCTAEDSCLSSHFTVMSFALLVQSADMFINCCCDCFCCTDRPCSLLTCSLASTLTTCAALTVLGIIKACQNLGLEACCILLLTRGLADNYALLVQVDPENMAKHEIAPLLEIQLELIVPDIVWIPELGSGGAPGVRDMFSKWFKSFLEIATLIKRLDTGEGQLPLAYILKQALQAVPMLCSLL